MIDSGLDELRVSLDSILQRLVYWGDGLATGDQSIYANTERGPGLGQNPAQTIAEAMRRAGGHGVSFRGADAQRPRASLLERPADPEPWQASQSAAAGGYLTAQGTALPGCSARFTDAPFESKRLGNYLEDGVEAVWHGAAYQRFREPRYSSEPPASCRNYGLAWSL